MSCWRYINNNLFVDEVDIERIVKRTGTPVYIYSLTEIEKRLKLLKVHFGDILHFIAYAVKANSNLSLLRFIRKNGCGAEVVSGGELFRTLKAGFSPSKIVFTGVGKTEEEISYAVRENVFMMVVESEDEMEILESIAKRMKKKVKFAVRVNPGVDPQTHPYIATSLKDSKFGVDEQTAFSIYRHSQKSSYLKPIGIHMHLGSQIKKVDVYLDGVERLIRLVQKLEENGLSIRYMDIGGGFGISYEDDREVIEIEKLASEIRKLITPYNLKVIMEPGRFIVGKSGILVGKVLYKKNAGKRKIYITDIGMNDLMRPALYGAKHRIIPVKMREGGDTYDVGGPVCESSDFVGKGILLPEMKRGENIAVLEAGAYGFVMASNYNSRPKPAEVMVKGKRFTVIRRRERYVDLVRGEL